MNLSPFTEPASSADLADRLREIVEIDEKVSSLEDEVKALRKRREYVEKLVVEDMASGKLDGVRAHGKSWRIEWTHSMSATEATKQPIIDALRECGVDPDSVIQINTARLKAISKELAEQRGADPRQPWTAGTPLEGIASEYVAPRLRFQTTG